MPSEKAAFIVAALNDSSIVIEHKIHARCITKGIAKQGAKHVFHKPTKNTIKSNHWKFHDYVVMFRL